MTDKPRESRNREGAGTGARKAGGSREAEAGVGREAGAEAAGDRDEAERKQRRGWGRGGAKVAGDRDDGTRQSESSAEDGDEGTRWERKRNRRRGRGESGIGDGDGDEAERKQRRRWGRGGSGSSAGDRDEGTRPVGSGSRSREGDEKAEREGRRVSSHAASSMGGKTGRWKREKGRWGSGSGKRTSMAGAAGVLDAGSYTYRL